jgi:hypothetical protein
LENKSRLSTTRSTWSQNPIAPTLSIPKIYCLSLKLCKDSTTSAKLIKGAYKIDFYSQQSAPETGDRLDIVNSNQALSHNANDSLFSDLEVIMHVSEFILILVGVKDVSVELFLMESFVPGHNLEDGAANVVFAI